MTPTFVLHIDKHNLSAALCPQSAVALLPPPSSPSVFLHLGLHRSPLQLQNNVGLFFFSPHIRCAFSRSVPLCHDLFMHYTSFLNNLSSHLSIFLPLLPPSLHPFSSAWLKAFHLSTISMPGHPPAPPKNPTTTTIQLNSYLPLYIPSSLPFLSFFSIFRPSYRPQSPSLCPLSLLSASSCPHPPHNPQLKLNPVSVSLARPRLPTRLSHTDPRNRP